MKKLTSVLLVLIMVLAMSVSAFAVNPLRNLSDSENQPVKIIVNDAKEELKKEEFRKRYINRVRSRNKKKYEYYFLTYGKAYAEMYIQSILWLEEVPFNPEVEEAFETIRNNERN